MTRRLFGRLDGIDVEEVTLRGHGLEAKVMTWGAVLRDLVVPGPGGPRGVVLGLDRLEDYVALSPNFGAVIGRYANRIGQARFSIDGREVALVANEGRHALHGGPAGFGRRIWSLLGHGETHAHLGLVSEDGDMGYPGRLFATATYEIAAPAVLRITLQALADAPTPVNLTPHGYFNLDGSADARGHSLEIASDLVLVADPELIPTGEIRAVAGTPHDFRHPRRIRPDGALLYDSTYVLRRERSPEPLLSYAATLSVPGLALEMWTSEPGLQLYDGHKVDVAVEGLRGARYGRFAGIALEPQRFPDAPNRSHFPPCMLSPGEVSRQVTELRFRAEAG